MSSSCYCCLWQVLLGHVGTAWHGSRAGARSLKQWDTLPRLCDAAMTLESPELQLMRSWRSMLTQVDWTALVGKSGITDVILNRHFLINTISNIST